MEKNTPIFPMPMRGILLLAGMYTFAWSAFFRYFGDDLLKWLSMNPGWDTALNARPMGTFGMLVGFLIFLSGFYPVSWQYLILAGIVGKIITALWYVLGIMPEMDWNKRTIFHLVFNELLWLIPMIIIYIRSVKVKRYLATLE